MRAARQQKTTLVKKGEAKAAWYVVDASERILGRLASRIAMVLMGKHKVNYTAHVDTGDFVIVTHCEKIRVTGKKAQSKTYERYTYRYGGHKVETYATVLSKQPERIIREAVRRMLPKTQMGRHMLKKLKVYRGGEHPHAAQQPAALPAN